MYKLMINNSVMEFKSSDERDAYIMDHWPELEDSDVLVPLEWANAWIDVRDMW